MKKLSAYILGIATALAATAYAAKNTDLVQIFGVTGQDTELRLSGGDAIIDYNQASNKLRFSNNGGADYKEIGSGAGGGSGLNILVDSNFDFEAGSPPTSWTASGGSFVSEVGSPLFGGQSGQWDASAASQTLSSAAIAIPEGLYGRNCSAKIDYLYETGSAGDYKLQAYDGTNVLNEVDLQVTDGVSLEGLLGFTCPSTGNLTLRLASTADGSAITVDGAHIGSDLIRFQIDQAALAVSAQHPTTTSCTWSRTSTTAGAFTTDADCPGLTVDLQSAGVVVDTTDVDLPQFSITTLPPGDYSLIVTTSLEVAGSGAVGGIALAKDTVLVDGKRSRGAQANDSDMVTLRHDFSVTTTTSTTYEIYGQSSSGSISIDLGSATGSTEVPIKWTLYRFPSTSQQSAILGAQNQVSSITYAGIASCLWSTTSASFADFAADTDCNTPTVTGNAVAPGSKIPSMDVSNVRAGKYLAIAYSHFRADESSSGTQGCSYRIDDGISPGHGVNLGSPVNAGWGNTSVVLAVFDYSAFQSSVTYDVQGARTSGNAPCSIDAQGTTAGFSMQLIPLTNGMDVKTIIENAVSSPGETDIKLVSARIENSGGTPSVTNENGNWIDSTTANGTGNFDINVTAGVFTTAPNCLCTQGDGTGGFCSINPPSTSVVNPETYNSGGAASNADVEVYCFGN